MDPLTFLKTVITTPQGYFCLATAGNGGTSWQEQWYSWPSQSADILGAALESMATHNVYFSAHLFGEKRALKAAVLPTRTIQADLDGADIHSLPLAPTALVQTSAGRHQGYWILKNKGDDGTDIIVPNDELESLSKRLSYSIPDCDRTGWPLGHRLRFPNTLNHKYGTAQPIEIITIGHRRIDPSTLDILPDVDYKGAPIEDWVTRPHEPLDDVPPMETIIALSKTGKISTIVRTQYSNISKDRSAALWRLMCELFTAGASRELVYWLAYNSSNNKFAERKYGGTRDLRKDIIRAESTTLTHGVNIREDIAKVRLMDGPSPNEKLDLITKAIIKYMQSIGSFVHGKDNVSYYVKLATGRPFVLSMHSERTEAFFTSELGINAATREFSYIMAGVAAHTLNLPYDTEITSLSYSDLDARILSVHTGKRDVITVTKDGRTTAPNGTSDVLFYWSGVAETFVISDDPLPDDVTWHDFLFESSLELIINMSPKAAKALMAVWVMYVLMRSTLTRPILALFGQPGSGKTALMRSVYRLLYGRVRDLAHVTTEEDFNIATSDNPLIVYDNVDSFKRWMPDALASVTGNTTIQKRKLWTDKDIMEYRRQAMVGMTAHSPKFIREDVADRLLVFILPRRPVYGNENEIQSRVIKYRSQLWGAILRDAQTILGLPIPSDKEVPQFRMQDFSTYGLWMARGIGVEAEFREGIKSLKSSQSSIIIEGEQHLTTAISGMITARAKVAGPIKFMGASELFTRLREHSGNPHEFERLHKGAKQLAQKLWVMQDALKGHFRIEMQDDSRTGSRSWLIDTKQEEENGQGN